MMRHRLILVAGLVVALVGCTARPGAFVSLPPSVTGGEAAGGSQGAAASGDVQAPVSEYGTLTLSIRWPDRPEGYHTALIPTSTNALAIKVSSGSTVVGETTVSRVGDQETATANLSLKAGNNLSVEVRAYRETAPIPQGASPIAQGTATVNIARSKKTSASISLTPLIVPTITGLSRNAGVTGDEVTITGTNFGSGSVPVFVYFNGYLTVGATRSSETSLTVKVPPGTPTGKVVVKADGVSSVSNVVFWVPKTLTLSTPRDFWDPSDASTQIVLLGKTKQLTATTTWATKLGETAEQYGTPPSPEWSSSDVSAGAVDSNGLFTAGNAYVAAGTNVWASHGSMSTSALKMIPEAVTFTLEPPAGSRILGGKGQPFLLYAGLNTFSDGATNSYVTYSAASASIDWFTGRATATDFKSNGTIIVSAESMVDPAQKTTTNITLSNYQVSRFAGDGGQGTTDGDVLAARFRRPQGMALDQAGNLYVADHDNGLIRRISGGSIGTVSLTGLPSIRPSGLAHYFDPVGSTSWLYVSDDANHKIYRIQLLGGGTSGSGTVLAGSGSPDMVDGAGIAASFDAPHGLVVDSNRNVYVADTNNHAIRKIDSNGIVSTMAGSVSGVDGHADAAIGTNARLRFPMGMARDASGNLFVTQMNDGRIRRITASGQVSTLTLSGRSFWNPYGIAVDGSGTLYVAEEDTNYISRVSPGGEVTVIAGSGGNNLVADIVDGIGTAASIRAPDYILLDGSGALYVSEYTNNIIRKLE